MIVLDNGTIRLLLDERNGSIRGLRDLRSGIDYSASESGGDPFRLETDAGFNSSFEAFEWSADGESAVSLSWRTAEGVTVHGLISLSREGDEAEFRCRAENGSPERLLSLEYPILSGLLPITKDGEDDYVAHPFATGAKIRNPAKCFDTDKRNLCYMPYPESFSGSTMQFFAYYGLGRGGLYFCAADGEGHPKWLNFQKDREGLLEASFIHGCEDMGPGKGVEPPYPLQIALLEGNDWYEAADRYKAWAVTQPWTAMGTLADRHAAGEDVGQWLHKDMGVSTFGINAGSDRTAWLRLYHEHIGTSMFHVLGPDWTNAPQTFGMGVPGGYDDWFPTRFNRDNLALMKELGDKFAPFEFDYLYNFNGADGELGLQAAQKFPEDKKSIDAYRFPFLCPAHEYTREFHVRRDADLQKADDVDAIYYDISANNILKICMDDSHGHPVGAGREIELAYRRNYAETKAAMAEAAGRYVPMGTEMMNETMLGLIDFYQARAGGQPSAPLELWPIRDLLKTGEAELIPMFDYVYHEYGALRMDGWGKLVGEIGPLYYYNVARVYLRGGLYELNHEYSPMETLADGSENSPDEHYAVYEPRGYAFSVERADFLGLYAGLRVGDANGYWAYGQMQRPLDYECSRIRMDWFHYNHGKESPEYNDSGEIEVPAVVHAAWKRADGAAGLFFANASGEGQLVRLKEAELSQRFDTEGNKSVQARIFRERGQAEGLDLAKDGKGGVEFHIPARCVAMLELA